MTEQEKDSRKLLERITMFNDAVYAIALTLLVLELKMPEDESCDTIAGMWHCIKEMTPQLFAFLLSIALVGGNWITSVNIQRIQVRADPGYLVYMVIYLSLISMTPFTCNIIGNHPDNPLSYVVFGIVVEILIINSFFYMRHVRTKKLYHPDVDMVEILKMEKAVIMVAFFIVAMSALAFYNTKLSFGLFLVFNLVPFFLTKSLKVNHKD